MDIAIMALAVLIGLSIGALIGLRSQETGSRQTVRGSKARGFRSTQRGPGNRSERFFWKRRKRVSRSGRRRRTS